MEATNARDERVSTSLASRATSRTFLSPRSSTPVTSHYDVQNAHPSLCMSARPADRAIPWPPGPETALS
jgi:hypothetical protein